MRLRRQASIRKLTRGMPPRSAIQGPAGWMLALAMGLGAATPWSHANDGRINGPIPPISSTKPIYTHAKAALGERLFSDKRLSKNNQIACVSCHDLGRGGTDGKKFSQGFNQALGDVNTPTVFNSSLNFRQFWDGRARNLEEQIDGPIHNPKEMASNWPEIVGKLSTDPNLPKEFKKIYPDGITERNIKDALVNFQSTLITPNSRFDRWLEGQDDAITENEKKGYALFISYGCVSCHQGVNIGGNMFQKFGILGDYLAKKGAPNKSDLGRFNVTGKESDKHSFKVPSLRNIALTAPYLHDGSAKTLDEAVHIMFVYQLGRRASAEDKTLIVQFLHTLTGEYKEKPLDQISTPSSSNARPAP